NVSILCLKAHEQSIRRPKQSHLGRPRRVAVFAFPVVLKVQRRTFQPGIAVRKPFCVRLVCKSRGKCRGQFAHPFVYERIHPPDSVIQRRRKAHPQNIGKEQKSSTPLKLPGHSNKGRDQQPQTKSGEDGLCSHWPDYQQTHCALPLERNLLRPAPRASIGFGPGSGAPRKENPIVERRHSVEVRTQPKRREPQEFEYVQLRLDSGVARLTLNRPEHNLLNEDMLRELVDGIAFVASHEEVKLIVLDSACKVFCGGIDVGEYTSERVFQMLDAF